MWDSGRMWVYHCQWRASMCCRTSSQICGSWYLPRFLFRDGSLTDEHGLLYGPADTVELPVHDGEIVQFDGVTCGVGAVWMGGRAFICSLHLSPKVLPVLPMYSTAFQIVRLAPVYYPYFPCDVFLVLGAH